ncbi:hypothetical protein AB0O75_27420 [Streptomyces sp. NPDC088921]|uniref:SLAC1 family transporter n=1 Tax=unclassified Streptomyces TaxID=2593676 RepID=UPI0034222B66
MPTKLAGKTWAAEMGQSKARFTYHSDTRIPQAFWAFAAIAWAWLITAHLVRGRRSEESLISQLRHPAQGPIAALAPVTAMLIAIDLSTWSVIAGRSLFFLALAASTLLAAWLLVHWIEGNIKPESMHPGYLLPTVAPGLIGGEGADALGYRGLAWALFGVGSFFGVVLTAIVLQRLTFRATLPDALLPTTAILLAPPAVAGLAWFSLQGATADPVAQSLAGIGVLLLLVQAAMLPRCRRLHFSIGFWSFTFPPAAAVALTVEWLEITEPAGWRVLTGVIVAVTIPFALVPAGSGARHTHR